MIGIIGLILLFILAIIDFIGVRVIDRNGLVFEIHCYSFGLTFWFASVIFSFTLYKLKLFKKIFLNIALCSLLGLLLGGIWWLLAYVFLMMGFHGTIGGWY